MIVHVNFLNCSCPAHSEIAMRSEEVMKVWAWSVFGEGRVVIDLGVEGRSVYYKARPGHLLLSKNGDQEIQLQREEDEGNV